MLRSLFALAVVSVIACIASAADPLVVGHRGLITHSPEETLANYNGCIDLRVCIELDVRRTKDGQLICMHDGNIDRTTDGKGKVTDLSLREIREFDAGKKFHPDFAGERVPTLEDVFALVRDRKATSLIISMDLKVLDCEVDALKLAEKYGVMKQLVFTGLTTRTPAIREKVLSLNKDAMCAVACVSSDKLADVLADKTCTWVYASFIPTAEEVKRAHEAGKKVYLVGSLVAGNEPENWTKGRAAGVDAILTDYPLECRESWRKEKK